MDKKNCWWYYQPWKYYSDSSINAYDDTKIKLSIDSCFWSDEVGIKQCYFPFRFNNKEVILYENKKFY